MIQLQRTFLELGSALDMQVLIDENIFLVDGSQIIVPVHMPELGSIRGIFIFSDANQVWPIRSEVKSSGFAYSVLDPGSGGSGFNVDDYKDMFKDWGWFGQESRKPVWMREHSR